MAQACKDNWVAGDACFDVLKIYFLYYYKIGAAIPKKVKEVFRCLKQAASESKLEHLQFKALLVQAFCNLKQKPERAIQIMEKANRKFQKKNLPSTNPIEIIYIEIVIYRYLGREDKVDLLKEIFFEQLHRMNENGCLASDGAFLFEKRDLINRILKEVNVE